MKGTISSLTVVCSHNLIYAPQYVAAELDLFRNRGVTVQFIAPASIYDLSEALQDNRAHVLLGNLWIPLVYAGRSDPLRILGQSNQQCHQVLVPRAGIAKFAWSMLRGATLVVPANAPTPLVAARTVMSLVGLDFNQVNLLTGFNTADSIRLFGDGIGDFLLVDAQTAIMENLSAGVPIAPLLGRVPWSVYCVRESTAHLKMEEILVFRQALNESLQWIREHSASEVSEVLAPRFPGVAREVRTSVVDRLRRLDLWPSQAELDLGEAEYWQDAMVRFGILARRVPLRDLVLEGGSRL